MTVEQMVRDLLAKAIQDGIVVFNSTNFTSTRDVQELSSGDLVGVTNMLGDFLNRKMMEMALRPPVPTPGCDPLSATVKIPPYESRR